MACVSRRWFIGGAAACGAFAGNRVFAANGFGGGTPRLKLGVITDIHVRNRAKPGDDETSSINELTFVKTLKWFRDQGVDGVVIAGDITDLGTIEELQTVADAWFGVFPNDLAPDGRKVERLFVTGNHDAFTADMLARPGISDRDMITADKSGVWQRMFHEPCEAVWTKEVKGYCFVGANWWTLNDGKKKAEAPNESITEWYAANARKIDPSLPFFHIQHQHPKDTCYGPWAWGHDVGNSTKVLSAHPNAVAISGHSHYPITDERSVWQGAFTSIGVGCLRALDIEEEEFGKVLANSRWGGRAENAAKLTPSITEGDVTRNGTLWSVYEDRIVIRRREFLPEADLGEDWVLPLPAAEQKPFAFAERAKKIGAPEFLAGAALKVERTSRKTRGAAPTRKTKLPAIEPVEKECLKVTVPAAIAKDGARAYRFDIVATYDEGGEKIERKMFAEGYHHSVRHPKATSETVCFIGLDELPKKGKMTFVVTPCNCFGRAGSPIRTCFDLI